MNSIESIKTYYQNNPDTNLSHEDCTDLKEIIAQSKDHKSLQEILELLEDLASRNRLAVQNAGSASDVLVAVVNKSYDLENEEGRFFREKVAKFCVDASQNGLAYSDLLTIFETLNSKNIFTGKLLREILKFINAELSSYGSDKETLRKLQNRLNELRMAVHDNENINQGVLTSAAQIVINLSDAQQIMNLPQNSSHPFSHKCEARVFSALSATGIPGVEEAVEEFMRGACADKELRVAYAKAKEKENESALSFKTRSSRVALMGGIASGLAGVALIAIGIASLALSHGMLAPLSMLALYHGKALLLKAGASFALGSLGLGIGVFALPRLVMKSGCCAEPVSVRAQ